MGAMKNGIKSRTIVLSSFLAGVLAVSAVSAADTHPEFGFNGLKRIELIFVNAAGGASGTAGQKPATPPPVPADDLSGRDLAQHKECQAIGRTLGNAGLEVVESCKPDDLACAKLYMTVTDQSAGRTADRIYLAGVELSQPMTLLRDKKVELTMPTTWAAQRVQVVPSDKSATEAACIALRSLGSWFGSQWMLANK